jgi:hypothetical protein
MVLGFLIPTLEDLFLNRIEFFRFEPEVDIVFVVEICATDLDFIPSRLIVWEDWPTRVRYDVIINFNCVTLFLFLGLRAITRSFARAVISDRSSSALIRLDFARQTLSAVPLVVLEMLQMLE